MRLARAINRAIRNITETRYCDASSWLRARYIDIATIAWGLVEI